MRPNRIYITGILLLFAFLSGRAQQPRIDELECRNLKIGYEKTLHMIFPTPVKYLNMGDENIIGEVIQVCPSVIRLKSTVRDFKGETNLSVVTEDSRYYTYCISFDEGAQAVYKEGGTMPETAVLPVSDEKLTHVILSGKNRVCGFRKHHRTGGESGECEQYCRTQGRVAVCPADQPYSHHRKRQVLYV